MNNCCSIGFTCDVCGRTVQGITLVNGMKFCAKCHQETFGNNTSQFVDMLIKETYELKISSLEKENAQLKKEIEICKRRIEELADQRENLYEETKMLNNWKETYYQYYQEFKHQCVILKKALLKASKEAFGNRVSFVSSNYPTKITNSVEYAEYLLSETEKEIKDGNQ